MAPMTRYGSEEKVEKPQVLAAEEEKVEDDADAKEAASKES